MKNKLEKKWKNESGDILVRETDNCGIVEILHLWDKNRSGCVIGCWRIRNADGHTEAEFVSISDRIMKTEYDNPEILIEVLRFGQKLADLIVETQGQN